MTDDTTITPLHQPGTILDPLTEIARDGVRHVEQERRFDEGKGEAPLAPPQEGPVAEPDAAADDVREHRLTGIRRQANADAAADQAIEVAFAVARVEHELAGRVMDQPRGLQHGTPNILGLLGEPPNLSTRRSASARSSPVVRPMLVGFMLASPFGRRTAFGLRRS